MAAVGTKVADYKSGKRSFELWTLSGMVESATKHHFTKVEGTKDSVTSTTHVNDMLILRDDRGGEHAISLVDLDLGCRTGHRLELWWIREPGENFGVHLSKELKEHRKGDMRDLAVLVNRDTNDEYWTSAVKDIFPWQSALSLGFGCFGAVIAAMGGLVVLDSLTSGNASQDTAKLIAGLLGLGVMVWSFREHHQHTAEYRKLIEFLRGQMGSKRA